MWERAAAEFARLGEEEEEEEEEEAPGADFCACATDVEKVRRALAHLVASRKRSRNVRKHLPAHFGNLFGQSLSLGDCKTYHPQVGALAAFLSSRVELSTQLAAPGPPAP